MKPIYFFTLSTLLCLFSIHIARANIADGITTINAMIEAVRKDREKIESKEEAIAKEAKMLEERNAALSSIEKELLLKPSHNLHETLQTFGDYLKKTEDLLEKLKTALMRDSSQQKA